MIDKKDYICAVPFQALEVHDHDRFICCASWMTKYLPKDSPVDEAWSSDEANDIRESVLDGSYRHCDSSQCPYLSELKHFTKPTNLGPLKHKNSLPRKLQTLIDDYKKGELHPPTNVQFSFDRSCNLQCPSCRIDMYIADSWKIKQVDATIEEIEEKFAKNLKSIYITGSGDPFVSVGFRNFLRNFDPNKYPKLTNIHLHTNATRWDRKMWESMPNIHPYVKTCEISIDAGTKETYENKTRIRGDWDQLIQNLKFIATLPNLTDVKPSFVVQKANYKEMEVFYNLMKKIFLEESSIPRNLRVFFGRITNWGTFTKEEFKHHQVWDNTHPEYEEFVKRINEIVNKPHMFHNLHDFIVNKRPEKVFI